MNLKLQSIEIPEEEPFQNDKLERKRCANILTNLIQNIPGEFVISINGGWGSGKTTFLKMWQQSLINQGFKTIYFNAWQDDYCNDALIALIGQLWDALKGTDLNEIATSIKQCAAPFFRKTVFNATRLMTAGVIELKEEELKSASEKAVDNYLKAGQNLKELKIRLEELALEVKIKTDNKPLILIIDELDRCRPTFAIEILEKIKHLFDTSNIIFVLGIDREQLGHSIKSVYGQDMNVNGYLRRFVDLEFLLPMNKNEAFIEHIIQKSGLSSCNQIWGQDRLKNALASLVDLYGLSLRDIETCLRIVSLALASGAVSLCLLVFMVILKVADTESYLFMFKGEFQSPKELFDILLKQRGGRRFLDSDDGLTLQCYLIAVTEESEEWRSDIELILKGQIGAKSSQVVTMLKQYNESQLKRMSEISDEIVREFRQGLDKRFVRHLSEKIELASLFVERNR